MYRLRLCNEFAESVVVAETLDQLMPKLEQHKDCAYWDIERKEGRTWNLFAASEEAQLPDVDSRPKRSRGRGDHRGLADIRLGA